MPAALPIQTKISQTSTSNRDYKVLEVKYGNSYSQRAGDGINNIQDQWSIVWENISSTDYGTITTALDAAFGSDYFTWQAPGDSASKKWVIKKFSKTALSGNIYTVTATLEQVWDL